MNNCEACSLAGSSCSYSPFIRTLLFSISSVQLLLEESYKSNMLQNNDTGVQQD